MSIASPLIRMRRTSRSGFSLVELMVVITVIAVGSALAVPSIRSRLADQRASEGAIAVMRLGRIARSNAIGFGRAYMVRFEPNQNGHFMVFRGEMSGCNQNNWETAILVRDPQCASADSGSLTNVSPCVDHVDFNDGYYNRDHEEVFTTAATTTEICFQPNGLVLTRTDNSRFVERNNAAGGLVFEIGRRADGAEVGVRRRVLFPLGSAPRLML